MSNLQSKLNTGCLVVMAISLIIIAYKQFEPNYVVTEKGEIIDTRSGRFYQRSGGEVIPLETSEEYLRRKYPDGRFQ